MVSQSPLTSGILLTPQTSISVWLSSNKQPTKLEYILGSIARVSITHQWSKNDTKHSNFSLSLDICIPEGSCPCSAPISGVCMTHLFSSPTSSLCAVAVRTLPPVDEFFCRFCVCFITRASSPSRIGTLYIFVSLVLCRMLLLGYPMYLKLKLELEISILCY